jgi:MFS family permease
MAIGLLLGGSLLVSLAFGMLLLLPLYVVQRGGTEADFGLIPFAATLTAVLAIGAIIRDPGRVPPHRLVAIAIASYAGAAAIVSSGTTGPMLIGLGVVFGTAWAIVYTGSPMIMSAMVADPDRGTFFGYLTGTQQLGIGLGPIIGRQLSETSLGLQGVFVVAAAIGSIGAICTGLIGRTRSVSAQSPRTSADSVRESLLQIARSRAMTPLAIVVLFACLFTALTSFQATFGRSVGLDYAIYYGWYTAAVLLARFAIGPALRRFDPVAVIAASIGLVCLATMSFLAVGSSALLYAAASATLGLGYGIGLPAAQAQVVNASAESLRPRALPLAGLLFQAAILGFPLVAGFLITRLGYDALFGVLLFVALTQAALATRWWLVGRSPTPQRSVSS